MQLIQPMTLKVLRTMYGMTTTEVSEKLKISQAYLSMLENGQRKISVQLERKIIEFFKLTDEEIQVFLQLEANRRKELLKSV